MPAATQAGAKNSETGDAIAIEQLASRWNAIKQGLQRLESAPGDLAPQQELAGLFAAGRGEALKRFLVEEGIGKEARFWKLAQSLSALYPPGIDEKRWVDGVLTRKKGLGF